MLLQSTLPDTSVIGKEPPRTFRVQDIQTPDISPTQLGEWKENNIYKPNPWYRSGEAIQEEFAKRFAVSTYQTESPVRPSRGQPKTATGPRPAAHNKPQATAGKQDDAKPVRRPDNPEPAGSSVFDDIAASADVLQQEKGRKRGKRNAPPTKTGGDL